VHVEYIPAILIAVHNVPYTQMCNASLPTSPPLPSHIQSPLTREHSRKGEHTPVKKHLPKLKIHPVPDKKPFKTPKEDREGYDARREEVGDLDTDFIPLDSGVSSVNK